MSFLGHVLVSSLPPNPAFSFYPTFSLLFYLSLSLPVFLSFLCVSLWKDSARYSLREVYREAVGEKGKPTQQSCTQLLLEASLLVYHVHSKCLV